MWKLRQKIENRRKLTNHPQPSPFGLLDVKINFSSNSNFGAPTAKSCFGEKLSEEIHNSKVENFSISTSLHFPFLFQRCHVRFYKQRISSHVCHRYEILKFSLIHLSHFINVDCALKCQSVISIHFAGVDGGDRYFSLELFTRHFDL